MLLSFVKTVFEHGEIDRNEDRNVHKFANGIDSEKYRTLGNRRDGALMELPE